MSNSPENDQTREAFAGHQTHTRVAIFNGPNLSRLGIREPDIYGKVSAEQLRRTLNDTANTLDFDVRIEFTNDEAELIEWIHECVDAAIPVVLNPAAFTHYSYGLRDACAQLTSSGIPLVEVHLSNPAARETFRHNSVISGIASGTIAGFGINSYVLALQALADMIKSASKTSA